MGPAIEFTLCSWRCGEQSGERDDYGADSAVTCVGEDQPDFGGVLGKHQGFGISESILQKLFVRRLAARQIDRL